MLLRRISVMNTKFLAAWAPAQHKIPKIDQNNVIKNVITDANKENFEDVQAKEKTEMNFIVYFNRNFNCPGRHPGGRLRDSSRFVFGACFRHFSCVFEVFPWGGGWGKNKRPNRTTKLWPEILYFRPMCGHIKVRSQNWHAIHGRPSRGAAIQQALKWRH